MRVPMSKRKGDYMKRIYLSVITVGLLLVMPALVYATNAPPVEQALVREGDYAIEMVKALNINTALDEATAENALATLGIAPQTGWISDFPLRLISLTSYRYQWMRLSKREDFI